MFSTRLNPTKPPAADRAILERVGAACRELQPIVEASPTANPPPDRIADVFGRHGVHTIGGTGTDSLLVAMAAERIGREGHSLARAFAKLVRDRQDRVASPGHDQPAVSAANVATGAPQPELDLSSLLDYRLCIAGSCVGALADCLEAFVEPAVAWITENKIISGGKLVEEQFGEMGANLEAARAITYAAAELKSELDRHPTSKHLQLESSTLVNEAALAANRTFQESLKQAAGVTAGDDSLANRIPKRHKHGDWNGELASIANEIGRYYLFL